MLSTRSGRLPPVSRFALQPARRMPPRQPPSVSELIENCVSSFLTNKKQNQGNRHPGITCDGCEKPIVSIRYKCLTCADFGKFKIPPGFYFEFFFFF